MCYQWQMTLSTATAGQTATIIQWPLVLYCWCEWATFVPLTQQWLFLLSSVLFATILIIICTRKSPYNALHPISWKFPQCCLWNSPNVHLIHDGLFAENWNSHFFDAIFCYFWCPVKLNTLQVLSFLYFGHEQWQSDWWNLVVLKWCHGSERVK